MKKTWNYDEPVWVNILGWIVGVILVLAIAFGFICFNGWAIMLLWNVTLPVLFSGVSAISFWQAVCIDLLAIFLFGGIGKIIVALLKDD